MSAAFYLLIGAAVGGAIVGMAVALAMLEVK